MTDLQYPSFFSVIERKFNGKKKDFPLVVFLINEKKQTKFGHLFSTTLFSVLGGVKEEEEEHGFLEKQTEFSDNK